MTRKIKKIYIKKIIKKTKSLDKSSIIILEEFISKKQIKKLKKLKKIKKSKKQKKIILERELKKLSIRKLRKIIKQVKFQKKLNITITKKSSFARRSYNVGYSTPAIFPLESIPTIPLSGGTRRTYRIPENPNINPNQKQKQDPESKQDPKSKHKPKLKRKQKLTVVKKTNLEQNQDKTLY